MQSSLEKNLSPPLHPPYSIHQAAVRPPKDFYPIPAADPPEQHASISPILGTQTEIKMGRAEIPENLRFQKHAPTSQDSPVKFAHGSGARLTRLLLFLFRYDSFILTDTPLPPSDSFHMTLFNASFFFQSYSHKVFIFTILFSKRLVIFFPYESFTI